MNEPLTLESIAKVCGVSHTTVSRALRGLGNVKPKTAERIREYAETVGYKPNAIARSLARSGGGEFHLASSRSIIVPYLEGLMKEDRNPLFWDYIEGAVKAAALRKSSIELMGFGLDGEFNFIRALVEENRIAGVLDLGLTPKTIDYLLSKSIPLVSRLQGVHEINSRQNACVYPDHIQGYLLAWNHLQSLGHRRFGFIARSDHRSRLAECVAASHLLKEPAALEPVIRIDNGASTESIREALLSQLGPWHAEKWPQVFFCSNDDVAHHVIRTLQEMNVSVPRQISIFGFDDSPAAGFCNPSITTLRNPRREIGAAMLDLLKEIIAGRPDSRNRVEILPMSLVLRQSVSKPLPTSNPLPQK
ncbi:MAG TPA: LacI family DNA-binding transcriptional regulator [Chthoniobacteraceae bacterium]|nr:LacI family DNA-binding transcriptional regulator [Chthoniobacteraceae bacterium]